MPTLRARAAIPNNALASESHPHLSLGTKPRTAAPNPELHGEGNLRLFDVGALVETGFDAVYMHLAHTPRLHARDTAETDQRIGSVGDTGNAQGCHLHFELWSEPGWYAGG